MITVYSESEGHTFSCLQCCLYSHINVSSNSNNNSNSNSNSNITSTTNRVIDQSPKRSTAAAQHSICIRHADGAPRHGRAQSARQEAVVCCLIVICPYSALFSKMLIQIRLNKDM